MSSRPPTSPGERTLEDSEEKIKGLHQDHNLACCASVCVSVSENLCYLVICAATESDLPKQSDRIGPEVLGGKILCAMSSSFLGHC